MGMKKTLRFLVRCFFYAVLLVIIDAVALFASISFNRNVLPFLSDFVVEGDVVLVISGLLESFSFLYIGKIRETTFHSSPWTLKRNKQTQRLTCITTGLILVLLGIVIAI